MKKLLAIAFVGGLILASCAKKENVEETNSMMAEPDSTMMTTASDSTMMATPMNDSTAVVAPVAVDSTMAK